MFRVAKWILIVGSSGSYARPIDSTRRRNRENDMRARHEEMAV